MKHQKSETVNKAKKKRGRPRSQNTIAVQTDLDLSDVTFTNVSIRDEVQINAVSPAEVSNDSRPEAGEESSSEKMSTEMVETPSTSKVTDHGSMLLPRPAVPPLRKTKQRFPTPYKSVPFRQNTLRPRLIGQNIIQHEPLHQQTEFVGHYSRSTSLLPQVLGSSSQNCRLPLPIPRKVPQNNEKTISNFPNPETHPSTSQQTTMDLDDLRNEVTQGHTQSGTVKIKKNSRRYVNFVRDKTQCQKLRSSAKKAIDFDFKGQNLSLEKSSENANNNEKERRQDTADLQPQTPEHGQKASKEATSFTSETGGVDQIDVARRREKSKTQTGIENPTLETDGVSNQDIPVSNEDTTNGGNQQDEGKKKTVTVKKRNSSKEVKKNQTESSGILKEFDQTTVGTSELNQMETDTDFIGANRLRKEMKKSVAVENSSAKCSGPSDIKNVQNKLQGKSREAISGRVMEESVKQTSTEVLVPVVKKLRFQEVAEVYEYKDEKLQKKQRTTKHGKVELDSAKKYSEQNVRTGNARMQGYTDDEETSNDNVRECRSPSPMVDESDRTGQHATVLVGCSASKGPEYLESEQQPELPGLDKSDRSHFDSNTNAYSQSKNQLKDVVKSRKKSSTNIWYGKKRRLRGGFGKQLQKKVSDCSSILSAVTEGNNSSGRVLTKTYQADAIGNEDEFGVKEHLVDEPQIEDLSELLEDGEQPREMFNDYSSIDSTGTLALQSDTSRTEDVNYSQFMADSDGSQSVVQKDSDDGQYSEVSEGHIQEVHMDSAGVEYDQYREVSWCHFEEDNTDQYMQDLGDGQSVSHVVSDEASYFPVISDDGNFTKVVDDCQSEVVSDNQLSDMTVDCDTSTKNSAISSIKTLDKVTERKQEQKSPDSRRSKYSRSAKTSALTAIGKLMVPTRSVKITVGSSSSQITTGKMADKGVVCLADSSVSEIHRSPLMQSCDSENNSNPFKWRSVPSDLQEKNTAELLSPNYEHENPEAEKSFSSKDHNLYQEECGTGPIDSTQSDLDDQEQDDNYQDSRSNTMKKYASLKSSYWRGMGGWEDSLRPKPRKTERFQIKHQQYNCKDKRTINKNEILVKPSKTLPAGHSTVPSHKHQEMSDTNIQQSERGFTSSVQQNSGLLSSCPPSSKDLGSLHIETGIGKIVWAKLGRDRWWPGLIVPGAMAKKQSADPGSSWVYWFGDHKISHIASEKIVPFVSNFSNFYGKKTGKLYQSAILETLQVCVERCGIAQSEDHLIQWAMDGFCTPQDRVMDQDTSPFDPVPGEELPITVLKNLKELHNKVGDCSETENKSRCRDARDSAVDLVKAGQKKLEDVCIACDDNDKSVHCPHPLFEGGLCRDCKDELTETLYCCGSDGTSVYCVICGFGGELFVCDNVGECGKAYCTECMELFLGESTVAKIRKANEWQCFLCTQYSTASHGCLHPHKDWQQRVIKLYDTGYRVIEPDLGYLSSVNKHQIRVLSLFDGIGTAKLILDNLNLDIDQFYSSEIDEDALLVSSIHHGSKIIQIGDVTKLNDEKLRSLCPIDLVIGGSPCNDFSLANPNRKGFEFGGTGTLFFHFYRVLKSVQNFNVGRHLFWLFENVASMKSEYKKEISIFLECDPALWDSKFFSAQNRARYFWGNIPGMYSTPELSQQYWTNFCLDTMLTPHCNRKATVDRIRTVTTRGNSLRQGKKEDLLPVVMNGKEDNIWITELERVFGFPPHYTDIGNLSTTRRQRLIGKSWSVPVVQYILSPLTQYFAVKMEPQSESSPQVL